MSNPSKEAIEAARAMWFDQLPITGLYKDWETRAAPFIQSAIDKALAASPWIKTSERAPTKEDGDKDGYVFATFGDDEEHEQDVGIFHYTELKKLTLNRYWTPIPALPEQGSGKEEE